jgi:hypothetical protein
VIAKITRGSRPGDIAAYLHGPGKANEHQFTKDYMRQRGGVVIGGNLGREGETDGTRWAQDLRAAAHTREDITKPIWQVSLRCAPGDRKLSDQEWADAGQQFAEQMGYANNPWVMVRHGDDHVHIVTSRVSETGEVWHARHDFRNAQRAATQLEKDYNLQQAPRQRAPQRDRIPQQRQNERYRGQERALTEHRAEELRRALEIRARATAGMMPIEEFAKTLKRPRTAEEREAEARNLAQRAREQADRDRDRNRDRGYGYDR